MNNINSDAKIKMKTWKKVLLIILLLFLSIAIIAIAYIGYVVKNAEKMERRR